MLKASQAFALVDEHLNANTHPRTIFLQQEFPIMVACKEREQVLSAAEIAHFESGNAFALPGLQHHGECQTLRKGSEIGRPGNFVGPRDRNVTLLRDFNREVFVQNALNNPRRGAGDVQQGTEDFIIFSNRSDRPVLHRNQHVETPLTDERNQRFCEQIRFSKKIRQVDEVANGPRAQLRI